MVPQSGATRFGGRRHQYCDDVFNGRRRSARHGRRDYLVSSGCGNAAVYNGAVPPWASVNAPAGLNYVIATPDLAMGYLFSYSLLAGPDGNKILWYVRAPRGGRPLLAEGHPLGSSKPTASFSQPADSSPGEIYPSGVTVPTAGCWRFHLAWNGYAADVDLLFSRATGG